MEALSVLGWQNEHELNSFPFTIPLVSDNKVEIPNGLIVDMQVVCRGIPVVRLLKITIEGGSVTVLFQITTEKEKITASASSTLVVGNSYADILDSSMNLYGKIVFGKDAYALSKKIAHGTYSFTRNIYSIEPSCISGIGYNQVNGIKALGSLERGAISFKEGSGVKINALHHTGDTKSYLQINAIGKKPSGCCPNNYLPLRNISVMSVSDGYKLVSPDENGHLDISTEVAIEPINKESTRQIIRIDTIENGIKIELL